MRRRTGDGLSESFIRGAQDLRQPEVFQLETSSGGKKEEERYRIGERTLLC